MNVLYAIWLIFGVFLLSQLEATAQRVACLLGLTSTGGHLHHMTLLQSKIGRSFYCLEAIPRIWGKDVESLGGLLVLLSPACSPPKAMNALTPLGPLKFG